MNRRSPVSLSPFRFKDPQTDDEMLVQLATYIAVLVTGLKTEKKQDRAFKKLEEVDLPAALEAIHKPAFLAGHILNQAMVRVAALAAEELSAEPPPW